MFSCFRISSIKVNAPLVLYLGLRGRGRKAILSWATIKYLRYIDESKSKIAIVSHQFCPPRLVLPVGGRVREERELGVKVTGLTLINNNFETYKQKFTNPEVFLNFNRINGLCYESFPPQTDYTTTSSPMIKKKKTFLKSFYTSFSESGLDKINC